MACAWRRASASAGSRWRASFRWPKCAPSAKLPIANWRYSSTARCAWRTPASASRPRPGAGAPPLPRRGGARAIRQATDCELEIFVHGALCVAYSGQCFSSEAWGGRSANRGQCAQACRLPYEMVVDGETKPLADARYLLSPGDLYALEQIPEIVQIGISAIDRKSTRLN